MSSMPYEILSLVFHHLKFKDLVQCQLVNKTWNQASLKLLYSEIKIHTEEKAFKFVRTINNSPQFGKYLETMVIDGLFNKDGRYEAWDKHRLLDTVIKYCPNLLRIHGNPNSSFWTRLTLAAAQGDLSRLQFISCPYNRVDFDSYIYTLLAFKQTITEVEIVDSESDDDLPDLIDAEAYTMFLDNVKGFPCLETLSLQYLSRHRITSYDALFNDCKSLKKVLITAEHGGVELSIDDIVIDAQFIHPCPNINTLQCEWDTLMTDNQMNYVMQKFPNLKSLIVYCGGYSYQCYNPDSVDILMNFLDFATNLQECAVNMVTEEEKAIDIWSSIINDKKNATVVDVCMSANDNIENPETIVRFKQPKITLEFKQSELTESRYLKFLSLIGKNVQSLSLGLDFMKRDNQYKLIDSIEKIIRAIQLCPLLEELELCNIYVFYFPNNITYQNPKIRSLKLTSCNYWSCIEILKNMSFIFPNLKEISIVDLFMGSSKYLVRELTMPSSNLDILRWTLGTKQKFFIRLEIDSVERFYKAFKGNLTLITKAQYNNRSPKMICLNITCRKLNKLEINHFTYSI